MMLKGNCEKCGGEIEFEDFSHLTQSVCPLCGQTITLVSHAEAKRRTEEATRLAHEKECREREEAKWRETQAQMKQEEDEQLRRIKTFRFAKDSPWWIIGWLSIILGSIGMFIYMVQPITTSGDTVNMGLMHSRQTGVIFCGFAILIGFIQLALAFLQSLTHNQRAQSYRESLKAHHYDPREIPLR